MGFKLVFCGTPQFAVPTLLALIDAGHEIALTLTQPDRPSGRGMQLLAPPVRQIAEAAGLEVLQPEKIKNNLELRARLEAIAPDAIIVVAYGRIIPKWMLDLPRLGNINLHGSLLPKYRGAAPIQWAIANGETVTGNTTMRIDEGLDTGDMLLQREISISPADTSEDLYPQLSQMGAHLMVETLEKLAAGSLPPIKQDDLKATLAPILTREEGQIDFSRTATEIYNRWRGFQPWPGAWTSFQQKKLMATRVRPAVNLAQQASGGELLIDGGRLYAACANNTWIELTDLQLEGKKRMATADFLRGHSAEERRQARLMIAPARSAASEILLKIQQNAGHCDELLRSAMVDRLSQQDRNLCTNLVMGTLRWQIALDARINELLARPDTRIDDEVRIALRLGIFQMLYLDRIPAHAAIMDSVELVKRTGQGFASGMVNAILRKIAVAPPVEAPTTFASVDELALTYAHPAWMVERWVTRYGKEKTEAICKFDQEQPPTTIRLVTEKAEAALLAEGIELAPGAFLTQARRVVRGDVTATVTYRDGGVRIQDEGSQLVAELAGNGENILDCCAAPGGKAAILAERNPKAILLACDVSRRRLDEMRTLLRTTRGARITYETVDAAKLVYDKHFDLVLCDVPCSGTGTIARNPEIRHRMEPAEFARQHSRQVAILLAGLRALKPGGRLVYASCSLEPEENEAVIQDCLSGRPEFAEVDLKERVESLTAQGFLHESSVAGLLERGRLRTIPGVQPCDGFFAGMITRT